MSVHASGLSYTDSASLQLSGMCQGSRVIEMACAGKTIRELEAWVPGKAGSEHIHHMLFPSRVLLEQFAEEMPGCCKLGTRYNDKIDCDCLEDAGRAEVRGCVRR